MPQYELKLGTSRLVLNSNLFTIKNIRKLDKELDLATGEFLDNVNNKMKLLNELGKGYQEILTKKDEESEEEYTERIKPLQEEINTKTEEIVGQDGMDSVLPLSYAAVKILAALDNQEGKVTPENFDSCVRDDLDTFIMDVCTKGKLKFKSIYKEFIKE